MAKKKSIRSKKGNNDTENESLTREQPLNVKIFLKNIWVIIALILFLSLFIKKILTISGDILWTGWLILVGCFALITCLGIWISPWIERITGIDEDKAKRRVCRGTARFVPLAH